MRIRVARRLPASGFTLIELLVVIAIIGILSAVVLVALSTARAKGDDASRVSDLHSIQTALELYANDHNGYPNLSCNSRPAFSTCWQSTLAPLLKPYIATLPVPPHNGAGEGAMCSNCDEFYYDAINGGNGYLLETFLAVDATPPETGKDPTYGPYYAIGQGCTPATNNFFGACH